MRGNRGRDTKPELFLRSQLHSRGLRFRITLSIRARGRLVRPDLVFPRPRLAVFVDGCFWHACPHHGAQPRSNAAYWGAKLRRNAERDRRATLVLEEEGWRVLRLWEHVPGPEMVNAVLKALANERTKEPKVWSLIA